LRRPNGAAVLFQSPRRHVRYILALVRMSSTRRVRVQYPHRRHFQANGAFGAFGAVTIDRKPKAALKALATMFGEKLEQ
jgi:hypothetical protein